MIKSLLLCLAAATSLISGSEWSDRWEADYAAGIQRVAERQPQVLQQHLQDYERQVTEDKSIIGDEFHCTPYKGEDKPTSVHELRPGDIYVVAALGDSISAGNGINAKLITGIVNNYRGYSWSIGGETSYEEGAHTLANVLKKYNHHVTGYALGTSKVDNVDLSRLNVAVAGSVASDLPPQSRMLVERLRDFPEVDFGDDWKMATLFIGGNDLCRACFDKEKFSTDSHVAHIQDALDILHETVPRMIVNVASIFDVTALDDINDKITCAVFHEVACQCGIGTSKPYVQELAREYADAVEKLIMSGRYDTRDDFTVVFQPFMRDMDIPRYPDGTVDLTYMAPDCFHFSQKGHNSIATFLWNSLYQPVGKKVTEMNFHDALYCPTHFQLIQTNKNREASKVEEPVEEEDKRLRDNPIAVACGVVLLLTLAGIMIGMAALAYRHHRNRHECLTDPKHRKKSKYDHKMMSA